MAEENNVEQNIEVAAENQTEQTPVQSETTAQQIDNTNSDSALKAELETLKAKNAELQHSYAVKSGQYGDELEKLRQSLAAMRGMNSKLLDKLAANSPDKKEAEEVESFKSIPNDVSENIGGDVSKSLMKWVVETVNRIVKHEIAIAIKTARQDLVENEIKPVANKSHQSEAAINNEIFLSAVEKLAPGFRAVNGNQFAGEKSDPQWDSFLQSTVPETDITWIQFFTNSNNDPKVAASAFKKFSSEKLAKKPVVVSAENQIAPSTVKNAARAPAGKQTLKREAFEKFKNEIYANPTEYGMDQRNKIMSEFCQAAVEGRLV